MATRLLEIGGMHPAVANTIAFLIAAVFGYGLMTYWNLQSRKGSTTLVRYLAVTALGAVCCAALSIIAHARGVHPWLAIAAIVLVVPLMTFVVHQRWTYRTNEHLATPDVAHAIRASDPRLSVLSVAVVCALVLVLHGAVLHGHWRWDDGPHLLQATQYSLIDLFTQPAVMRHASGNQIAPFNLAIYIVNLWTFGAEPIWFYAQNLAMLAAAGVALLALLRLWLHPFAALAGAVLMLGGLPVSQMAAQLQCGHYILGLIFVCAMFWIYAQAVSTDKQWESWAYSLLAALFYALACLCKEVYVPAVLVLPFLPNLEKRPFRISQLRFAVPSLLVAGTYAVMRLILFQGLGGYFFGNFNAQTLTSIAGMGTTLLGTAWAGAIGLLLLIGSIVGMVWKCPLRRLSLLIALVVAVCAPIAILAASQPDWGQHARFLFLPWVLVCISWAVFLSPTLTTTHVNTALRVIAFLSFAIAAMPAAQSRFVQDAETHAMMDAYSRHVTGPNAAQPILPTLIIAPGYQNVSLSAVNAFQRTQPLRGTQPQPRLHMIHPSTLTEVPQNTLTWQPSCLCLVHWSEIPSIVQATLIQRQQIRLVGAPPVKAPWPPWADGNDGEIEKMTRQGNRIAMSGWLPTTGVGVVLAILGSPAPVQDIDLRLTPRDAAAERDFVLSFTVSERFSEQLTPLCLLVLSQRAGEEHHLMNVKWANATLQTQCVGLVHPAGQRMAQSHK